MQNACDGCCAPTAITAPNFASTPLSESGCLLTDANGNDLVEGDWGSTTPTPCPSIRKAPPSGYEYPFGDANIRIHLPIESQPQSFSVASRHIASFQAGDSMNVAANIEVTMPDVDTLDADTVVGTLILANSPTATTDTPGVITLALANGGTINQVYQQHHYPIVSRATYTSTESDDPAVAWASQGQLYVNFVATTASPSQSKAVGQAAGCTAAKPYEDPCTEQAFNLQNGSGCQAQPSVCLDAFGSKLSVHTFRPAKQGDALMAVDPMVTTPVSAAVLTPAGAGKPVYAPAWVSKPLTDLAVGDILEVRADVALSYSGDGSGCTGCGANGTDPCAPNDHPNDPNISAQVFLTQDPTLSGDLFDSANPGHECYENGSCTVIISGDANTNLTPNLPRITLSPFGEFLVLPSLGYQDSCVNTDCPTWSGSSAKPWYLVVEVGQAGDSSCSVRTVNVDPAKSNVAAYHFHKAAHGTPGWQEANNSTVEALVGAIAAGSGPTVLYQSASFSPLPGEVDDVASAVELKAGSCAKSTIDTLLSLGTQSFGHPEEAGLPGASGSSVVFHDGAIAPGNVGQTSVSSSATEQGCPSASVSIDKTRGGLSVERFWPTNALAP